MDPITLALIGGGLAGGLLGGHGRKPIDPAMLARLFGPNALAGDTQTLYNTLAASPMFSQLMSSASSMGTQAGNRSNAAFARAGLSGSGIGAVNSAVSSGFGQDMMLRARGNLWQAAQQQALQSLMGRMGIYGQSQLQYQQTPTMAQSFGNALTGMAEAGLSAKMQGAAPKPTQNWGSLGTQDYGSFLKPDLGGYNEGRFLGGGIYPGTSVTSAPMRRLNPTQRPQMFNYYNGGF